MTSLKDPVTAVKYISAKRAEALADLGIETVQDLLWHFPFRYEDQQERDLSTVLDQEKIHLVGRVLTPAVVNYYGGRKNRLAFKMAVGDHVVQVAFFNQHYLKSKVEVGQSIAIYGKWEEKRQTLLGMKILSAGQDQAFAAVYHSNQALKQSTWVKMVSQALDQYREAIEELLPEQILHKYRFVPYRFALETMHFPKDMGHYQEAQRRLIYQELFSYQLKLALLKEERRQKQGRPLVYDNQALKAYIATIPFELTGAQKRVTNAICKDLLAPFAMNRLLQGDVGSGKTVVASIGLRAAILAGYQTALMVPTEILAQQHYQTLQDLFAGESVRLALLTGSTSSKERKIILRDLAAGDLDLVIGTHALIQGDVAFAKLGFVIIDEQHRFGVAQREALKDKTVERNVLYMTATPIPRTLAMSVYGEMDVSVIDELPKGRQVIQTRLVKEEDFDRVLSFIHQKIQEGQQAYVITPLIEESEESDLKNAHETCQRIQEGLGEQIRVALLHGRMKPGDKEAIMADFQANRIQVLVSTTVIEVGVNVPNATVMLIQDAERFGLAQLHQLRGRVGRGSNQSYCLLLANPKTDTGKKRMKIMTESNDGFYLSQQDMLLRGSGDIFGLKQSGAPSFALADLIRDYEVLQAVNADLEDLRLDKDFRKHNALLLESLSVKMTKKDDMKDEDLKREENRN